MPNKRFQPDGPALRDAVWSGDGRIGEAAAQVVLVAGVQPNSAREAGEVLEDELAPDVARPVVVVTGDVGSNETWSAANYYVLRGAVFVRSSPRIKTASASSTSRTASCCSSPVWPPSPSASWSPSWRS